MIPAFYRSLPWTTILPGGIRAALIVIQLALGVATLVHSAALLNQCLDAAAQTPPPRPVGGADL